MSAELAADGLSERALAWRRDRIFFTGISIAAALTVFVGFAPSYFLKGVFGHPPLPALLHLHGARWAGGLFLLVSQPLRLVVSGTGAWLSFAGWLTR